MNKEKTKKKHKLKNTLEVITNINQLKLGDLIVYKDMYLGEVACIDNEHIYMENLLEGNNTFMKINYIEVVLNNTLEKINHE